MLHETYQALANTLLATPPTPASASVPIVGTDVQAVAPVLETLRGPLRQAYLARVVTDRERAECTDGTSELVAAESLAARFAAKEAVLKVLRPAPGAARPPWRDIEIVRDAAGAPGVVLHGAAARLAVVRGLDSWSCSLAHDGGVAVATVAALIRPAPHTPTPRPSRKVRHGHR